MPPRGTSGTAGGGGTRNGGSRVGLRNPGIQPQLWNLIAVYSGRLGLDPYAVAAVSRVEGGGRFGEVGDNGTSFGPFQLHVGGALPPGRNAAWANSAAGVLYAMQHMSTVARGLRGLPAVRAIVSRFERPAAPGPEIASAWSGYRSFGVPIPGGADTRNYQVQVQNPMGSQWIQQMKGFQAQQTKLFAQSQQNLLKELASQAAQTRQQNLSSAAQAAQQQLVSQAQQQQRLLSGAGSLTGSGVPALGVYDQKKTILDQVRSQALRRAGIL